MERMIKSWICMNASRFSMCARRVCAKMHALSVGIRSGVFYGAEDEKGCVFLFLIFPSTDLSSSLCMTPNKIHSFMTAQQCSTHLDGLMT